jgi:uncharacterized protein YbaP (TraB family)
MSRLRPQLALALLALLVLLAASPLPARQAEALHAPIRLPPPIPLLWRVGEGPRTVYLLGTFHLLRADDYPLHPAVYAALDDAEEVWFELPGETLFDPALGQRLAEAGRRTDGSSLREELGSTEWARLGAAARAVGIDPRSLEPMQAWLAALTLSIAHMRAAGLDPALGLDRHIAGRAARAGKPIAGLETKEQQIALFAGLPPELQRRQLADVVTRSRELRAEVAWLHAQWRDGDADALYWGMAANLKAREPALYARLNRDRNEAWLPLIRDRLAGAGSDDTLVAVGSLHLVGADGLVQRLAELGYRVERIAGDSPRAP